MNLIALVRTFYKGLGRIFKIINYGDVPLIYNNPIYMEKYAFASRSLVGYWKSVAELGREMLRPTLKIYSIPSGAIIFCGGSSNNEREFHFFSSLLAERQCPGYSRESNLSFVPARQLKKSMVEYLFSLLFMVLGCFYMLRIKLCPISFKYLLFYTKIYFFLYSSLMRSEEKPRLLVVANDHTDFPVVASMLMQYFGIPVVYVQHAEISERFPALDFNVSILRNEVSREKYQAIGPIKGDVFVVPRSPKNHMFERVLRARSVTSPVVVYISSVYSESGLARCLSQLASNASVTSVSVKPHPRTDISSLNFGPDVTLVTSVPSFDHVAVVPNSSVVVELLEQGVPVYQLFDLDDIGHDYYSFVEKGVAPAISFEDLTGNFWGGNFYNDVWVERFSKFSPSIDPAWVAELAVLLDKVGLYISGSGDHR
jgi:hypothetical protein